MARLTQKEIARRIAEVWDDAVTSALGVSDETARAVIRSMFGVPSSKRQNYSDTEQLAAVVRASLGIQFRQALRKMTKTFKTEEQLEKYLSEVREAGETMPTTMRRALQDLTASLPRRGGPGRKAKLSPSKARIACDHVATFFRNGDSVKAALAKVATNSEALLGVKVSARTLQKAWDARAKAE